jgi:preprotein translocase subunit SecF
MRKGTPLQIVNTSINQTLARTLMTSLTTLLVLVMLYIFGGEAIHAFSLALILGVVVGTYSSIYIASTTALALGISKQDLMPTSKDEGAGDSAP